MKNFILLILLVLTQSLGDIWLSRGMKGFNDVNFLDQSIVLKLIVYLLTNPWLWLGVITLILALFLYYASLSRLPLSLVLPVMASNYIFNALFASLILGENVTVIRWTVALLITVGVFIVGINEDFSSPEPNLPSYQSEKKPWFNWFWVFLLPVSFSTPPTWLLILIIALTDACENLLIAKGMKNIGAVKFVSIPQLIKLAGKILTNPFILQAFAFQVTGFFCFVLALSLADISFVRPATALAYPMSLLGAKFFFNETITIGRLVGLIFVGVGIILMAFDHQVI